MRVWLACVVLASLAFTAQAKELPSFDCGRAGTAIEKRICGDDYLAQADRYLAAVYAERLVRASNEEKNALIREQREWLKDLHEQCAGRDDPNREFPWRGDMADCLADNYDHRIDQVEPPLRSFVDLAEDAPNTADVCTAVSSLATFEGKRLIKRHALSVRELENLDGIEHLFEPGTWAKITNPESDLYMSTENLNQAGRVRLWKDKPEAWVLWGTVGSLANPEIYLLEPDAETDKPAQQIGYIGEEGSGPFNWYFIRFHGRPYVLIATRNELGMEVLDLDWSKNVCRKD